MHQGHISCLSQLLLQYLSCEICFQFCLDICDCTLAQMTVTAWLSQFLLHCIYYQYRKYSLKIFVCKDMYLLTLSLCFRMDLRAKLSNVDKLAHIGLVSKSRVSFYSKSRNFLHNITLVSFSALPTNGLLLVIQAQCNRVYAVSFSRWCWPIIKYMS